MKNTSTDNLGNIFEIFGDDNPRQKTQPEEDKKFKTRPRSGKEGRNSGTSKPSNMYNRDNIHYSTNNYCTLVMQVKVKRHNMKNKGNLPLGNGEKF